MSVIGWMAVYELIHFGRAVSASAGESVLLPLSLLHCQFVLSMGLYNSFMILYVPSKFPPCRPFVLKRLFLSIANYILSLQFTPGTVGLYAFLVCHIYFLIALYRWSPFRDRYSALSSSPPGPCDHALSILLRVDRMATPISNMPCSTQIVDG